ncbi:PIR Superfamily Protein [Plasmodium malariae]|uniref:PIR Superfamily Protein n=1 Tax=Plasmodium malariae TaxID=5858 RepID=A0A1A8WVG6_PLAMA|nr:PIR Superfamily Protein [Plasmodium malariae]
MSTSYDSSWDNILVGSLSYNIYNSFSNEVIGTNYDKYCNIFNNSHGSDDNEDYNLCKKIARNVDILSNYLNKIEYTSLCSHYRYWAYHNIKKVLGENTDNEKARDIIRKLKQAQNSIDEAYYSYYCRYNLKDNISQRLKEKLKEKHLHDYFNNYDSIKKYETCKSVNLEKYEKYLNYINNLHKKYRSEKDCCDGSWQYECLDYFRCADEFDPSKLLSALKSNGNKNCDNLKVLEKPLAFDNLGNHGSSQQDVRSSIYLVKCTDITNDRISDNKLIGGKIKCQVLPSSTASLNNPSSSFTHRPPDHVPFTIGGHIETPISTELGRDNQVSSGSSRSKNHLSNSHASDVIKDNSADRYTPCENLLLSRDASGKCIEPDVRKTNTIGVKLDVLLLLEDVFIKKYQEKKELTIIMMIRICGSLLSALQNRLKEELGIGDCNSLIILDEILFNDF